MTASDPVSICLIGGTGRSGTTILRKVFGRHTRVAIAPQETRLLIDPDGLVDMYDSFAAGWSPYAFDVKVRRLEKLLKEIGTSSASASVMNALNARAHGKGAGTPTGRRKLAGSGKSALASVGAIKAVSRLLPRYSNVNILDLCPGYGDLVAKLMSDLIDFEFEGRWSGTPRWHDSAIRFGPPMGTEDLTAALGSFYSQVCSGIAAGQGATHFVEDSPLNILSFDRIIKLVPGARLLHIFRDPRDVVASYTKQRWGPSDPLQAARMYRQIMETWLEVRQNVPPDSFIEFSLESLTADPEVVLRRLCDFCGLPWENGLLDIDLSHSHSGRWKIDLTRGEQEQVSEMVAPFLDRLGYVA